MKALLGVIAVLGVSACGGGGTPAAEAAGGTSTASSAGGSAPGNAGAGGASDGAGGGPGGAEAGTGGGNGGPATFTLSLNVNGEGRVTSTPAGIDCGQSCTASFPAGTNVQLTSLAEGGVLTGWGEVCSGRAPCSLTLQADSLVTATFEPFSVGAGAHGVAVTADGRLLVTRSEGAGSLQVHSLLDGALLDSFSVGSFPNAVAVLPDATKAVVNNLDSVSVVDLVTRVVTTVAPPCAGDTLYDVALTPDGTRAITTMFTASCSTNSVSVVDLGSASLSNQFSIPAQLTGGIAVTPDGASALVSLGILGTRVSRVALAGGAITDIQNTSSSFGIAVTPDGSEALIASGDGDTIKRVSLATNMLTGSIDYASNQDPHDIAITPDGSLAVVVGSFDVGVLSLASGSVLKTFAGGGRSVAISPDGRRALVSQGSNVRVFSLP